MSTATPAARSAARSTSTISRHVPPRSISDNAVAAPTAPAPTTPTFTTTPPESEPGPVLRRLEQARLHRYPVWCNRPVVQPAAYSLHRSSAAPRPRLIENGGRSESLDARL